MTKPILIYRDVFTSLEETQIVRRYISQCVQDQYVVIVLNSELEEHRGGVFEIIEPKSNKK